ncbi:DNA replication/repair protein RecF [Leucobacter soli]|uniref:DNA replication/repair protein RecF n=1 Tax=Leucobacter soli TaxID=2812850 RepID=UPI0036171C1D
MIVGRNGQGKTNLVEAIAYFASLRSHRVTGDAALIRAAADTGVARMRIAVGEREALLEVELNRQGVNRARVNRNGVKPRQLTRWFSTVLFAPEDLSIVRGEPAVRRRFLDDALVARNPALAGVLADYERVVRQRTALLKSARASGARSSLDATLGLWDEKLVELGARIMVERRRLVEALCAPLIESYRDLADADHSPRLTVEESVGAASDPDVSRETDRSASPPAGGEIPRRLWGTWNPRSMFHVKRSSARSAMHWPPSVRRRSSGPSRSSARTGTTWHSASMICP